jgi:hypothetical protein
MRHAVRFALLTLLAGSTGLQAQLSQPLVSTGEDSPFE